MDDQEILQMTVRGLMLDPVTNVPIVILKAEGESRLLPIWIGLFEANAIALVLEKVQTTRPMTHDLLQNLVQLLGARVERTVVDNLREHTFFASVYLHTVAGEQRLDARPSDAIALALRAGAPIFATRDVLSRSRNVEIEEDLGEPEQWRQWLDHLRPSDFGQDPATGGPRNTQD